MRRALVVGVASAALLIVAAPVALAGGDPNAGSIGDSSSSSSRNGSKSGSKHITGNYPDSCHAVGQLPDKDCTPGSVSDAVTQDNLKSTICEKGYADKVRPPGSEAARLKTKAMKAYGVPMSARATTQFDHLIPLEIGGSNDVKNLWPQRDHKYYVQKDNVEDRLRAGICSDKVKLHAAQDAISKDWTTALHKLGLD